MFKNNKYLTLLNDSSGQAVVVILLVAVVGLTIGLSIAGTTLQNIEETSTTEERNRAFSAAEAGVEEALYQIESGTSPGSVNVPNQTFTDSGSSIEAVTVSEIQSLSLDRLLVDDVTQVSLDCSALGGCGAGTVVVAWDQHASGNALVMTKIGEPSAGNYTVDRYAYRCNLTASNGFSDASIVGGRCTATINVNGTQDKLLRIRAMYQDITSLSVDPGAGTVLPSQSVVISSTGSSGDAEATVQIERTAPIPPAILDFVLFSATGGLSN